MRVLLVPPLRVGNADEPQQVESALPDRSVLLARVVGLDRLANLSTNLQDRIQRGHRILEDHCDIVAADTPQLPLRQLQ